MNDDGMVNLKPCNGVVKLGNGTHVQCNIIGNYKCLIDGVKVLLRYVKVIPDLWINLFSIRKVMKDGATLSNTKDALTVRKGPVLVTFVDISANDTNSLLVAKIMPQEEVAAPMDGTKKININKAHQVLGHVSVEVTKQIAKVLGWELTGSFNVCEACIKGKAKQKAVPKLIMSPSDNNKYYFDISSIKSASLGGSKHWLMIVHGETQMKWSNFLSTKIQFLTAMIKWVDNIRKLGKNVKVLRCDNAGENQSFCETSKEKQLHIIFEFTSPKTPQ